MFHLMVSMRKGLPFYTVWGRIVARQKEEGKWARLQAGYTFAGKTNLRLVLHKMVRFGGKFEKISFLGRYSE